ncbi:AAA family ATPase [Spirosoma areae]
MNEAMTPEELLKAENTFIRLHNQGVSVEEIAEKLGLNTDIVQSWKAKMEEVLSVRLKNTPKDAVLEVLGKKNNELYIGRTIFNQATHKIEEIREIISLIANRNEGDEPDSPMTQTIRQAKSYLKLINEDLIYLSIITSNGKVVEYNYELAHESSEEKLEIFVNFYNSLIATASSISTESILIKKPSEDIFDNVLQTLPFCIKQISIVNYQDIRQCELKALPIDSKWIFILGENGYGKTTFLRSIILGLFGWKDGDKSLLEDTFIKVGVEFINDHINIINNLWTPDFRPLEHLACYGPSRLQIQAKMSQNEEAEKSTTTYGLFNPDGILLNIESKLIEWHLEKNDRLEQVKSLFRDVIPYLADIIIQKNKQDDYEVLYVERAEDDEATTFDPVPFNQLAAGFRSIIGLIGDLLIRFIRKQPDVTKLSDLAGIVLIDELENHLHPKWQYQLPTLLSKVFPNIQFIAATHSVIPILGAPKNSIFLKLNRSKEKGITVERIDIDVANLLPNSILTSPIFDMDTIRPIANEDVGQLRTEDTYNEVVANNDIDKQLRELDNDPSQYPALLQE